MKTKKKITPLSKTPRTLVRPRRGRKLLRRARFLPALLIAGFATFLTLQPLLQQPGAGGVLAYATNVSPAGLLVSTNDERTANGLSNLAANGLLNAAAQAKAEDMVARNYWSHVTPDGQQPWVFITNAGYQYSSAGENLAYGFMTSSSTVTGWMNSAPHKANLLSANYTEVGFGIANAPDYVSNGQQTIVVAMYGKPLVAAAPVASKSATKPASTPVAAAPTKPVEPVVNEVAAAPIVEQEIINVAQEHEEAAPIVASSTNVQRVQTLGIGSATWSVTLVILAVMSTVILWVVHKGFHLGRYFIAGERFVLQHIHLDFTVVAVVYLAAVLLSSSGTIR